MKIKVSEASGPVLDWMVRYAQNGRPPIDYVPNRDNFSTCWNKGGPIIEREKIDILALRTGDGGFRAYHTPTHEAKTHTYAEGPTPLIAACRCYVASKLGDTAEVPDELCGG